MTWSVCRAILETCDTNSTADAMATKLSKFCCITVRDSVCKPSRKCRLPEFAVSSWLRAVGNAGVGVVDGTCGVDSIRATCSTPADADDTGSIGTDSTSSVPVLLEVRSLMSRCRLRDWLCRLGRFDATDRGMATGTSLLAFCGIVRLSVLSVAVLDVTGDMTCSEVSEIASWPGECDLAPGCRFVK